MNKCQNCKSKSDYIKNYVVKFESWEGYNCCCEGCAIESAKKDGISEDEIKDVS